MSEGKRGLRVGDGVTPGLAVLEPRAAGELPAAPLRVARRETWP